MNRFIRRALIAGVGLSAAIPVAAVAATTVPGQTGGRTDTDNNGFPDAGVQVVGHYTDDAFYPGCSLTVNYKGDFGNDAYLNSGEIQNHYVCKSDGMTATFNYLIVSSDDPRYNPDPQWEAFGGGWSYSILTQGGQGNEAYGGNGNLVRPYNNQ